jgi:LysM repeat protein
MVWMGTPEGEIPDPPACTLLGLVDDPRSHFTYPHQAHRCFASKSAQTTDLRRQQVFCLSGEFVECDRYVGWRRSVASKSPSEAAPPTGATPPVEAAAPPVSPVSGSTVIYVFRAGDSLARIANTYGLTIDQIVVANRLDPNVAVKDGTRLVLPIDRPAADTAVAPKARRKASR